MDEFFDKVYEIVARIPRGKVATYGQIADLLGYPRRARTVGWAMRVVPADLKLPCHRVIYASGCLPPCHCFGGVDIQRTMLEDEEITFRPNGCVDIRQHLWQDDIARFP